MYSGFYPRSIHVGLIRYLPSMPGSMMGVEFAARSRALLWRYCQVINTCKAGWYTLVRNCNKTPEEHQKFTLIQIVRISPQVFFVTYYIFHIYIVRIPL